MRHVGNQIGEKQLDSILSSVREMNDNDTGGRECTGGVEDSIQSSIQNAERELQSFAARFRQEVAQTPSSFAICSVPA